MIILAQNGDAIYDTDKGLSISAKDKIVYLLNYSGELAYTLGEYKDNDRAKAVVEDIFVMQNCQDKYEMPLV